MVTSSVYEIDTGDGIRYAKRWSSRKCDLLEELTAIDDQIGMPRSEVIDTDACVQVMEPAPGRPLSRTLLWRTLPGVWRQQKESTYEGMSAVGERLGRLHTLTGARSEPVDVTDLHLDKYDAITTDGVSPSVKRKFDETVVTELKHALDVMDGKQLPTSIVHGDLMLFHVYISERQPTIIDFDRASTEFPIEDAATFLGALDIYSRRVPYVRRSHLDDLTSAFLDGYQSSGPFDEIDTNLLSTLQAIRYCSLLRYYDERVGSNASGKLRILKRIDVPLLKKAVSDILRT